MAWTKERISPEYSDQIKAVRAAFRRKGISIRQWCLQAPLEEQVHPVIVTELLKGKLKGNRGKAAVARRRLVAEFGDQLGMMPIFMF